MKFETNSNIVSGVIVFVAMAALCPSLCAGQGASLLPNGSFEMASPEGVQGGTSRAWHNDIALEKEDLVSEETKATLIIDTDATLVPYSPMIFGGFLEHFDRQIYGGIFEPGSPLSDENGFRKDVIEAMKALKLAVVRWPGGCFASGYHWQDGVGEDRKPTRDPVWGVEDPNTFGTDEFRLWCQAVGCEPYICTNAGNGTPEEMKAWVQYCDRKDGRLSSLPKVKFWSIGNENWGSHEIGARTPEDWGPLVATCARMMLDVRPDLDLVAAATSNRGWTLPLLAQAGSALDYIAIHEYWLPCWGENLTPDYLSCILSSQGPEQTISSVIDVLKEAGVHGRVKIAFDEWNLRGWHHPGFPRKEPSDSADPAVIELIKNRDKNDMASQYSMADALFSASFLNACLRHSEDVGMANIAPIVNTRGPLYVHPKGLVKRTTFHVLSLYANELEDRVGQVEVACGMLTLNERSVPVLDALATTDASRKRWTLALVNRHPSQEVTCVVRMKQTPREGSCEAILLSGTSPEDYNDMEHPDRVVPERRTLLFKDGTLRLPAHSLILLKMEAP